MRALLVLLVACGTRDEPRPPPVETVEARPTCKPGRTICAGDDVKMCENGTYHRTVASCRGGCREGACVDTCGANDIELIYVVDYERVLLSFDPRKLPGDPFKTIGTLTCDPESKPYSMAVDRAGVAWIVYLTGVLYQVSILDAHCFTGASRVSGGPPGTGFGMGFVTDGPKTTTEKLYATATASGELATIDTRTLPAEWKPVGRVPNAATRSPELTGEADGKLYAYFPGEDDRGFVQQIDRTGAVTGKRWSLPAGKGAVGGYAFAFWGDVFYVFVTFNNANEVHAVHRKTGKTELVIKRSDHEIVGAGVSTCAPLLERP